MELQEPKNKVLRVRTSDGRLDFIHGNRITSAGLVKEKDGKAESWSLVINYEGPFYTKIKNKRELLRTIEALYGQDSLKEAEQLIGTKLDSLPAEASRV